MNYLIEHLEKIEQQYEELNKLLSDTDVIKDRNRLQKIASEHAELSPLIETYQQYKKVLKSIEENKALLDEKDEELRELAKVELQELKAKQKSLEDSLKLMLIPKDPRDEKNVVLEIRAGTGGEEAALFAMDLFRMYSKFAERNKWKIEILSQNITGLGGVKEIIALIEGKRAYSKLKYESGVHRVQRVPKTEAQGRIHTSTVTVAVLPEAGEVDVEIKPEDLRIDVYRSSGPGGQSVNTTDSAVRITHLPTGMVVTCQDEKSQHKNKAKALKVLRARLLDKAIREQQEEISKQRRDQIGTGERSERIRTYNFPQGRVTDHRIGLTLYQLNEILEGNLDELITHLITYYQAQAIEKMAL